MDEMEGSFGDCDSFSWPKGPAMLYMMLMASDNQIFYKHYLKAWNSATRAGWDLTPLQGLDEDQLNQSDDNDYDDLDLDEDAALLESLDFFD